MLASADGQRTISKKESKKLLRVLGERIYCLQKASWDARLPVIVLVEGWETVGKNGLIRALTGPLDPRGFVFHAIREPETHERARPWMWRFWQRIPERGQWAIFDQSWYRRVLIERPHNQISEQELRRALRDINDFERTLSDDGTLLLKFFLHTEKNSFKSKASLIADPENPAKSPDPRLLSRRYDQRAGFYEDALRHTQQEWAPWITIPADDKPTARVLFLEAIVLSLQSRLGIACEPEKSNVESGVRASKRKAPKPRRARQARDRLPAPPAEAIRAEAEAIADATEALPDVAAAQPATQTEASTRISAEISPLDEQGQDLTNGSLSAPEGDA